MKFYIILAIIIVYFSNLNCMKYEFYETETNLNQNVNPILEKNDEAYPEIILDINDDKITKNMDQNSKNNALIKQIKKAIEKKDLASIILLMHNNEMTNLKEFMKQIQLSRQEQDAINNINNRKSRYWNICQTGTTIIVMGTLVAITQLIPKYAP